MNVLETYSAEEIVEQTFSLARGDYTQELQRLPKAAHPNEGKNKHGDTLLMLAAYNGHKETTQLLLDYGLLRYKRSNRFDVCSHVQPSKSDQI